MHAREYFSTWLHDHAGIRNRVCVHNCPPNPGTAWSWAGQLPCLSTGDTAGLCLGPHLFEGGAATQNTKCIRTSLRDPSIEIIPLGLVVYI